METIIQNPGYLYSFPKRGFRNHANESKHTSLNKHKKEMILVLIADDHPYLIHGVESDLNKDPKIKIVGACNSYTELREKVKQLQVDIILLDLRMPDRDEIDLKEYITEIKHISNSKVIIFTNESGWARIHKCLDIGASSYIEKAISIGKLAELIRKVHENDEIVIFTAEQIPQIQFSPRQKEILHYIADGKENDQISEILDIEVKTVQSYVNEVKEKLSEAFSIHPIRPRTLLLLASKLGFGNKVK